MQSLAIRWSRDLKLTQPKVAKARDIYECFGRRLRELRKERGLSQARLAERANLTTEFIGRLERGRTGPSLETVGDLARALSVEPKNLFEFRALRAVVLEPALIRLADLANHATSEERKVLLRLAEALIYQRKKR